MPWKAAITIRESEQHLQSGLLMTKISLWVTLKCARETFVPMDRRLLLGACQK